MLLLKLDLPEQAMGWLPLRFGIVEDKPTKFSCTFIVCLQVVFIDYGNVEWVHTDSLCKLSSDDIDLPPQAFECVLAKVKPAYSMMSRGFWSPVAKRRFEELSCNKELFISVNALC
jgi:hypothetical protein